MSLNSWSVISVCGVGVGVSGFFGFPLQFAETKAIGVKIEPMLNVNNMFLNFFALFSPIF